MPHARHAVRDTLAQKSRRADAQTRLCRRPVACSVLSLATFTLACKARRCVRARECVAESTKSGAANRITSRAVVGSRQTGLCRAVRLEAGPCVRCSRPEACPRAQQGASVVPGSRARARSHTIYCSRAAVSIRLRPLVCGTMRAAAARRPDSAQTESCARSRLRRSPRPARSVSCACGHAPRVVEVAWLNTMSRLTRRC